MPVQIKANTDEHCRFCNPPDEDRILLTTPHFYVMLSLGPIIEGYCLIITREHTDCCGAIPQALLPEFLLLLTAVQTAQRRLYGNSIFYEHGRTGSCLPDARGEPHCHHAHLHCVPITFDMRAQVHENYPTVVLPGWNEFLEGYQETLEPYLLVEDDGQPCVAAVPDRIPRQYLRTLVAHVCGEDHLADWGAFQGWELIGLAKERLGPELLRAAGEAAIEFTG